MKRELRGTEAVETLYPCTYWLGVAVLSMLLTMAAKAQEGGTNSVIDAGAVFNHVVEPVGPSATAAGERAVIAAVLRAADRRSPYEAMALLEDFLAENPGSVWGPSLRANLAEFYFQDGRYTRALAHWEQAWESTKTYDSGPGRRVAGQVVASLGKVEAVQDAKATAAAEETKVPTRGAPGDIVCRHNDGFDRLSDMLPGELRQRRGEEPWSGSRQYGYMARLQGCLRSKVCC